jgi:hypothetical protein
LQYIYSFNRPMRICSWFGHSRHMRLVFSIAHAYCIWFLGIVYEVFVTGILDYPCISHYRASICEVSLRYPRSPMHIALSGIAHAFRIIGIYMGFPSRPCISHCQAFDISYMRCPFGILDCSCISHYRALPMHIALSGIRHRRCIIHRQ